VEVAVATVIFLIAGIAVFGFIRMSAYSVVSGNQKVRADQFGPQVLEQVKAEAATQYDDLDALTFTGLNYTQMADNSPLQLHRICG